MLYKVLRTWCKWALPFYFARVHCENVARIPQKGPVIIVANHQNTFLDAIIIATLVSRPVYSIARGDIFKMTLLKQLLKALHMLPIYRFRDGHAALKQNNQSFSQMLQVLQKGDVLLIFPEGNHAQEYALRPLQKGTARLAFAYQQDQPDITLTIQPVGLHYSIHQKSMGKLEVEVGESIKLDKLEETNQRDFSLALTQKVEDSLAQLVLHDRNALSSEVAKNKDGSTPKHGSVLEKYIHRIVKWFIKLLLLPALSLPLLLLQFVVKNREFRAGLVFALSALLVPPYVVVVFAWITWQLGIGIAATILATFFGLYFIMKRTAPT